MEKVIREKSYVLKSWWQQPALNRQGVIYPPPQKKFRICENGMVLKILSLYISVI